MGGVVFVFIVIFIVIGRLVLKKLETKNRNKLKKLTKDLKVLVIHGIHQTVYNGAIPLQVVALLSIKYGIEKQQSYTILICPSLTLTFIICYHIITYKYLSTRVDRLEDVDEENLRMKHRAVFANLRYYRKERMGLGYTFFIHYRRLFYSIIIVLLQDYPAQQI